MATYDLYVQTGPQRKSTMVHVPGLLGCSVYARTADDAIAQAPAEIARYLAWLRGHGDTVDRGPVRVRVVEETREGGFIGTANLATDLDPVTPADVTRYARWLAWGRADLLALVKDLDRTALDAKPKAGRTIRGILEHVLGADKAYLYAAVGIEKSVGDPTNAALAGKLDLRVALAEERAAAVERIRQVTPEERRRVRQGGMTTYTLRRCLRSMLAHEWEHRREIERRLAP